MNDKDKVIKIVKIISKLHGELWDNMEEWLRMYASEIGYKTRRLENGDYQSILMLNGEEMLTLRKTSRDLDNVKRYAYEYIEHLKKEKGSKR